MAGRLSRRVLCVLIPGLLALAAGTASAVPIGDERAVRRHLDQAAIAAGEIHTEQLVEVGRALFVAKFTRLDGAGRPRASNAIVPTRVGPQTEHGFLRTAGPDANACSGCHNDPAPGGAGEFVANVFVAEGFRDPRFDSVDPQFSNERGTPPMHGAGFVELLAREMTRDLRAQRAEAAREARRSGEPVRVALQTKGVSFGHLTARPDGFVDVSGLEGVDQDLVVRPFSQKGVFTSLRQFTVNALNGHHGIQAAERFGKRWTGYADFDGDGVSEEATPGDVTALVAFQATLPTPRQVLPEHPERRAAAREGERLFEQVGCAECHVQRLPLESAEFTEPNPYNPAGNLRTEEVEAPVRIDLAPLARAAGFERDDQGRWLVPVYSDLKRHVIADEEQPYFANELLAQRFVNRDVFLTPKLWGVASTAPYGHRGDVTTLDRAIRYHGGEGTAARKAYEALPDMDRRRIVEFLLSLKIPEGSS